MKQILIKILPLTILLISISSILAWCSLPIGNTTIWWSIQCLIIYIFIKLSPPQYHIVPIKIFILYLIFSAVYGAIFMTENYWDWKLLVDNLMIFSLPLATYTYRQPHRVTQTLKYWFKYAWIILIPLVPFLSSDAYGRFLVPFTFLAILLPILNKKFIVLTLIAFFITITLGNESRSDTIKFSFCCLLGLSLYFLNANKNHKKKFIIISHCILLTPIILFSLGVTNTFNVFRIEEEFKLNDKYIIKSSDGKEFSALTDTRTFLYIEEIQSAINNNYVIMGRSIARGYDSPSFGDWADETMHLSRGERPSCETSILNIFNYFGVIGVILYFFIFYSATYLAIIKSKNIYIKIIGIYVAFRWFFAWIEDFSRFDLNYLFLWIFIGMCYSPVFRNMTNYNFKLWIKTFIK